jgi:PilZ domain-containing protein
MMMEQSGADYLRRLKADVERPPVTPFPASTPSSAQADGQGAPSQNPQERRRSPRYKCAGSAEFRVGGTDVRTWGTFTDLSIHGCSIEMTATFPVGSIVDLALEVNGVRVNVMGEVRVSYPFLGIGVAFPDVSPESARTLQSTVGTLLARERKAAGGPASEGSSQAAAPLIANPAAALQSIADFFESHPILTKNDFLQMIRENQTQVR